MHSCSFFPLRETERLRRSWCPVLVDIDPDGNISFSSLRNKIASYSSFASSFQLDLTLHNVTEHHELRARVESDAPLSQNHLDVAPRMSSTNKLPPQNCIFVLAVDNPPPRTPPPRTPPLSAPDCSTPTPKTVLPQELPTVVEFSRQLLAQEKLKTLTDVELLGKIVIFVKESARPEKRVKTAPEKRVKTAPDQLKYSVTMHDCEPNGVQNRQRAIPRPPEWVNSFVIDMTRRREIPTHVRYPRAIYFKTDVQFQGFNLLCDQARIFDDPDLMRIVQSHFVCNDAELIVNSTGQSLASRTLECSLFSGTLQPSHPPWNERKFLNFLISNFSEWGSRRHMGDHQPQL